MTYQGANQQGQQWLQDQAPDWLRQGSNYVDQTMQTPGVEALLPMVGTVKLSARKTGPKTLFIDWLGIDNPLEARTAIRKILSKANQVGADKLEFYPRDFNLGTGGRSMLDFTNLVGGIQVNREGKYLLPINRLRDLLFGGQ